MAPSGFISFIGDGDMGGRTEWAPRWRSQPEEAVEAGLHSELKV